MSSQAISQAEHRSHSGLPESPMQVTGTAGTAVDLRMNAFRVEFAENSVIYEYSFVIEPRSDSSDSDAAAYLLREALNSLRYEKVVHDGGRRLFSASQLRSNAGNAIGTKEEGQDHSVEVERSLGQGPTQNYKVVFSLIRQTTNEDVKK